MKKIFSVFLIILLNFNIFSQNISAFDANRKTAIRCLKLAEIYLSSNDFGNALAQVETALSYDETISDLLYLEALCKLSLGEKKAEVLKIITKAFTNGQWIDYNKNNARILYADLLCDTGKYDSALNILNTEPFLYSADSEFIRSKCLYNLKTEETLTQAREKIDSARKIYPKDLRFPTLFFKYEYSLNSHKNLEENKLVQKIAEYFIQKMPEYDNPNAELEIYASIFSSGEKQRRLLQAFSSHDLTHPLYAIYALKTNLISQEDAFSYLQNFSDDSIDLKILEEFLPLITEENVINSIKEYFNSYEGTILIDSNKNLEPNFRIKYYRGRSQSLTFDFENDDIVDLSCNFDFGVPIDFTTADSIKFTYGTYPSIYKINTNSDYDNMELIFTDDGFSFTPFNIQLFIPLKKLTGINFFVPYGTIAEVPTIEQILPTITKINISSEEKENSTISLNMLNGNIQSASYSQNGIPYAFSEFLNDNKISRTVDNDGDGVFELTEFYETLTESDFKEFPDLNFEQINENSKKIAGTFNKQPLFLKNIQLDSNLDTIPDFSEEYFLNGDKTTIWDKNFDGIWDIRYKKYNPKNNQNILIEESSFYKNSNTDLVTVRFENSIPVKVFENNSEFSVTQGNNKSFYWIDNVGTFDEEKFILENSAFLSQEKTEILQTEKNRIRVILISNKIFAEIIQPDLKISEENNTQNGTN